jgi:hypothetical protein
MMLLTFTQLTIFSCYISIMQTAKSQEALLEGHACPVPFQFVASSHIESQPYHNHDYFEHC